MVTTIGMGVGFTRALSVLGTAITTAYTGNTVTIDTHSSESAAIYISYTKGGETNVDVEVRVGNSTTGFSIVPYSYLSATSLFELTLTATATGLKRWIIPRLGKFEQQIKISAKSATAASANATTALLIDVQLNSSNNPVSGGSLT